MGRTEKVDSHSIELEAASIVEKTLTGCRYPEMQHVCEIVIPFLADSRTNSSEGALSYKTAIVGYGLDALSTPRMFHD